MKTQVFIQSTILLATLNQTIERFQEGKKLETWKFRRLRILIILNMLADKIKLKDMCLRVCKFKD